MGDMSAIIVPKSDQINADDLLGRTITITVSDVKIRGGQEQPISIEFEGSDKVFRPCKSMCRVMAQAWGLDSKLYVGRSMTLYCDPTVKFGPLAVGGIRISHMSHIDGPMVMALTATKGVKKSYKVQPLVNAPASTATAGLNLSTAEADLRNATTLDELKVAWLRKSMAPHREALAAVLEERKAAFAFDDQVGPSDDQRGETNAATATEQSRADELIGFIGKKARHTDLDALMKDWRAESEDWDEETQARVNDAYIARMAEIDA